MLSLAVYYIVAKMINYVLDGFNHGKSVTIITEKPDEIGERITKELNLSITYLYGEGRFLSKKKKIIYCITNPFIYSKLKRVILSVDANAIMEASYVWETSGLDS